MGDTASKLGVSEQRTARLLPDVRSLRDLLTEDTPHSVLTDSAASKLGENDGQIARSLADVRALHDLVPDATLHTQAPLIYSITPCVRTVSSGGRGCDAWMLLLIVRYRTGYR